MRCNNTWNFINGSGWSYSDALVVCRELGYENVTSFCPMDTMYSIPRPPFNRVRRGLNFNTNELVPSIIKGLQCIGTENSSKQCLVNSATSLLSNLFRGLPPDTPRKVGNVAWVSCGGGPNLSISLCACLQLQQVFCCEVLMCCLLYTSPSPRD